MVVALRFVDIRFVAIILLWMRRRSTQWLLSPATVPITRTCLAGYFLLYRFGGMIHPAYSFSLAVSEEYYCLAAIR